MLEGLVFPSISEIAFAAKVVVFADPAILCSIRTGRELCSTWLCSAVGLSSIELHYRWWANINNKRKYLRVRCNDLKIGLTIQMNPIVRTALDSD